MIEPLSKPELERLVLIMRDMQQFATKGDWQELARLDDERRALLQYDPNFNSKAGIISKTGNTSTDGSKTPGISGSDSLIDEILLLDELIIKAVQKARGKLLAQNRELSAQVKAKSLYAQTSLIS